MAAVGGSGLLQPLRKHGRGVFGLLVIIAVILGALLAPYIAPYDPIETDLPARLKPPGWSAEGGMPHLFGTDELGRDLFSRVVFGARISLLVGLTSVVISGFFGVLLGLFAGYYGQLAGQIIMRLTDIQMAFPFIVLTIAVIAVLGSSLTNVIVVLALASWVVYCRVTRALTLSIRDREFVESARAIGCRDWRIIARHIFPNTLPTVIVIATYQLATMIVAESALSFLGLGVPPPTPSWGSCISGGRDYLDMAWWMTTFPGLALVLTTMGATFLGDWAREVLDPNMRV